MPPIVRCLVAILAIACQGVLAQNGVPPVVTVQGLAPQLVAFSGSQANFQNLVNGLAQGTPVQLVSTLPNGSTQIVTFTPTTMSANDIAVTLEAARQQLITFGIASPTAEQIGFTLMGGVVPTALGGRQVAGLLNPRNPRSPAAQLQSSNLAAAGGSVPTSTSVIPPVSAVTGVNVQILPPTAPTTPAVAAMPRNTSDSVIDAGATSRSRAVNTSASPLPPPATVPGAAVQQQPRTVERVRPR